MTTVSVIMPVFNAGPWISRALSGVLGQRGVEIDLICVNDASTDASGEIIAGFASRHPNLRLVNQPHSGPGMARNRGLELAIGDYVFFHDADDELIIPDALYRCAEEMKIGDLDALLFDAQVESENSSAVPGKGLPVGRYQRQGAYPDVIAGAEMLVALVRNNEFFAAPYMMMLRREFLIQKGLRFPDVRYFYEDNIFTTHMLLLAEHVRYRPWRPYLRRMHSGSIMTGASTHFHRLGYRACLIDVCRLLRQRNLKRSVRMALRDREQVYRTALRRIDGFGLSLMDLLRQSCVRLRCRSFAYLVKRIAFGRKRSL